MPDAALDRCDLADFDDRPTRCPHCGGKIVRDWDGDASVIGGTRDWVACDDCGKSPDEEAEDADEKPRVKWTTCAVCGRGLSVEDRERETGMCLPCETEALP